MGRIECEYGRQSVFQDMKDEIHKSYILGKEIKIEDTEYRQYEQEGP